MFSFSKFGNDLYTGERSYNFVGRRRIWYTVAFIMIGLSILLPILRGGFVFGIEFSGGSEFQISGVAHVEQQVATDAVTSVVADATPRVSTVGTDSVRVQTEQLTTEQSTGVRDALASAYDVPTDQVTSSFIGPTWGADITGAAVRALVVFVILAALLMAVYFRTWKMSLAAVVSLLHDMIITVGVYGAFGFEITPAAVIGFLTILGYSLYDTVVVFDKIRENTGEATGRTFAESVNLAVNQTLVRSINTGVVAALPVGAILFIGTTLLGAGTLRDISLALFVGIVIGTYSTIFIGAPLYSQLREKEPEIAKSSEKIKANSSRVTSGAVR